VQDSGELVPSAIAVRDHHGPADQSEHGPWKPAFSDAELVGAAADRRRSRKRAGRNTEL
jgi:hypothetical protein